MSPLLFIHIPKTAGTSFRKAAEKSFLADNILYDYGVHQQETSVIIKEQVYGQNDIYSIHNELKGKAVKMLGGHVPMRKYASLFSQNNIITFVREPISRLVSEYKHFCRHYGLKSSLDEFVRRPEFINRQTKMFSDFDPAVIGFIGVTEYYRESLELINTSYEVSIANLSENMAGNQHAPKYEIEGDLLDFVLNENRNDILLYEQCCQLFKQRLELFKGNQVYVHGKVGGYHNEILSGWAFFANSQDPVELYVERNDKYIGTILAKELRPHLMQYNVPRGGYVGYSIKIPDLREQDNIRVYVRETGQLLPANPLFA